MGTKIKDAELISKVTGEERIPVSDGSGKAKAVRLSQVGMIEVTYDELVALRDNAKLIPGMMYRMTDYETTTAQGGTRSAGHPFDLILTALDEKTLDEKCSAIHSARDTEGYFANSDLTAWQVWYSLDNDANRFGWAEISGLIIKVDFSVLNEGIVAALYDGTFIFIDGKEYYKWYMPSWNAYVLTTNKEPSIGDTTIFVVINNGEIEYADNIGIVSSSISNSKGGKGVIYRMIDESQNDISYDFKNIMFVRKIYDGNIDTENGVDTFVYTFNFYGNDKSEDYSILFPFNCCSNYMDYNVRLHNNVFFVNTPYGSFICNIFNYDSIDNTLINSCSFNSFIERCTNNELHEGCCHNTLKDYCSYNTFEDDCNNNVLHDSSSYNLFGYSCYNNILKNGCRDNTFGASSKDNILKSSCKENVFGEGCKYNILEESCLVNSFGNNCCRNKLGRASLQNKFGEYCCDNTLQGFSSTSMCSWNEFGNYCNQIVLENNCSFNKIGNVNENFYANLITLKSGVSRVKLTATGTPNSSNYAQNYIIFNIKGSSSSPLEINIERNVQYTTHVTQSSNGGIIQYTDEDIYNAINK